MSLIALAGSVWLTFAAALLESFNAREAEGEGAVEGEAEGAAEGAEAGGGEGGEAEREADGGEGGELAVAEKPWAPKDTDELLNAIATQDYGVSDDRSAKLATPAIKAYNAVADRYHQTLHGAVPRLPARTRADLH